MARTVSDERPLGLSERLRFYASSRRLIAIRWFRDWRRPVPLLPLGEVSAFPFEGPSSRSVLHGDSREALFTAGKEENLRIAGELLNGRVIAAGETLSFWRQIGRPTVRRGFRVGREIRSGCLVPSVGGGLCQLSGALFEAARESGLEIVEFHRHSRRLAGQTYVPERDATVFWNYVDLRVKAKQEVLIECRVEEGHLVTRFRSKAPFPVVAKKELQSVAAADANDCLTCGKTSCSGFEDTQRIAVGRVWLTRADLALLAKLGKPYAVTRSLRASHFLERLVQHALHRMGWAVGRIALVKARLSATLFRLSCLRIPENVLVSQSVLPFLYSWLQARGVRYTVFAPHLPMRELQAELDRLAAVHPADKQLSDFRAPDGLVEKEWDGMVAAARLLVVHPRVKALFPWAEFLGVAMPSVVARRGVLRTFIFPGPLVAREGGYEVVEAARRLNREVVSFHVSARGGKHGIRFVTLEDALRLDGAVVIHPTVYETPTAPILKFCEMGFPIIGTRGLPLADGSFYRVGLGDVDGIVEAVGKIENIS